MKHNPFKKITEWFQKVQQTSTSTETDIVPQPTPEEIEVQKREEKRKIWMEEFRLWLNTLNPWLVALLVSSPVAIIVASINNIEKIQKVFEPSLTEFSCERIVFKIPQNWQAQGCTPLAFRPDAQIILKSFKDNEVNSPKILLISKDVNDPAFRLRDFYNMQKQGIQRLVSDKVNPDFMFKTYNAFQLVYEHNQVKRLDIGFLSKDKAYIIRYEANVKDFDKYKKKAEDIIYSVEVTQDDQEK